MLKWEARLFSSKKNLWAVYQIRLPSHEPTTIGLMILRQENAKYTTELTTQLARENNPMLISSYAGMQEFFKSNPRSHSFRINLCFSFHFLELVLEPFSLVRSKLDSMTLLTVTTDEDEYAENLNECLHSLLGYENHEEEPHPWHCIPRSMIQLASDALLAFRNVHSDNFIALRWQSELNRFLNVKDLTPGASTNEVSPIPTPAQVKPVGSPGISKTFPGCQAAKDQSSPMAPIVQPSDPPAKATPAWQRYNHSVGGSSNRVATRRRKKKSPAELKLGDFDRASVKIGGQDVVNKLRETWNRMDTSYGGLEW